MYPVWIKSFVVQWNSSRSVGTFILAFWFRSRWLHWSTFLACPCLEGFGSLCRVGSGHLWDGSTAPLNAFETKQDGKMYFRITFPAFPASLDTGAWDQGTALKCVCFECECQALCTNCFANHLLLVHTSGWYRMNILYTEFDLQSKVRCVSRGLWKEISACLNPDTTTSLARFLLGCFQNHVFHCLDQEYNCLCLELNQYLKFGCKLQWSGIQLPYTLSGGSFAFELPLIN